MNKLDRQTPQSGRKVSTLQKVSSLLALALLTGSVTFTAQAQDAQDLVNAANSAEEWLSYGRDYAETRFSPLQQITAANITQLGVAWTFDTDSFRGLEATPLMHDGILYATRPWSSVFAVDARSGRQLWNYDPQVDKSIGWKACCDVVNRGVALYEGKVYVGTIDGRLIALDAKTGKEVWSVLTVDPNRPYTITGAPRVADGKVIIGNGGAELGSRGYLTAYDANTGAQVWRFWVVPGNPADGFENPDVEFAAQTWNGNWWEVGGGGNPWDAIIYDPDARLVYVGTGNGSPWSHELRSNGVGDNLFLSSIVALDVDDGRVAWYYQTTPADNWDYTAVQPLMLAELMIDGVLRKVIMQAPKNGFFYVLDRLTGELLSATPYAEVSWASGISIETGRPIETPQARYDNAISFVYPGPGGAHNWHPMSYNPITGLVYLPSQQGSNFPYSVEQGFVHKPGTWNIGVTMGTLADVPLRPESEYSPGTGPATRSPGALVAWDPLAKQPRWVIDYPFGINGGTLTTAGNLVFQGGADGHFRAYSADAGDLLWNVDLGVGIIAAPMTYELDGRQYVSVLAGWGGSAGLIGPNVSGEYKAEGRLWTFVLGGDQNIEPVQGQPLPELTAIAYDDSAELIARGADLYGKRCMVCHGAGAVSGGALADLRHASAATYNIFHNIVREGAYTGLGMPNLGKFVSPADADAIKAYLLSLRAALMAGE
ncbi:MAG: PQQ-dependent dehydrogenase, methanol/ethanol family [Pseudomonadales bacterium]|nr:PQQ-dependent dehydrogenase, methanol/ethanol family [Pseudomonadales bacterium]